MAAALSVTVAAAAAAAVAVAARRSTCPGCVAEGRAAAAECPGTRPGTAPVAATTSLGAPGPAAELQAPVALVAAAPGSDSPEIVAVAVPTVRGIYS